MRTKLISRTRTRTRRICQMACLALAGVLAASGGTLKVQVRSNVSQQVVNRKVTLTLTEAGPVTAGPWLIAGDWVSQFTDTNGLTYFSNVLAGQYRLDIAGTPSRSFPLGMPDTNGLIDAAALIGTTNSEPLFYTAAQIDQLIAGGPGGGGIAAAAGSGIKITTNLSLVTVSTNGETLSWPGQVQWPLNAVTNANHNTNWALISTNSMAGTNSVINFRLFNDGRLYGPQGQISTAGTTTMGLQEAINACLTSTSLHTQPAGGGRIILEPGTYLCTSQITISNRFSNPISIEGVSDAPSTILRLRPGSTLDGILSTAPASTGNLSLNLRNLVLAYEGIFKKRVMKLTDVQRLQCDNVYFCSWGFVTNGGLDGNVFSSYATAHGASVVGVELGSYDFSDSPFGLAIFNNCRFADLAAAAYTSIDHTWFYKCHFLLIGGASKQSPGTNNWSAGGSFTVPDSMYSLHPAIVNYSLNGDVRIDDPNIYFTYCLLLNAHQGAFGHPLIRNTTAAGLESSAWMLLQYDDLNNGNAGQQVEIESAPEPGLLGNISLVAKPGTITNRYPANVRFSKNGSYSWGPFTNLTLAKIQGSTAGADYAGFDAGVSAGQNRFLGTNVFDQVLAGISVDRSTLTVSGGTDTGINGTYYLSDRMYVEASAGGSVNIFSWTNSTWAIVVDADTINSINGGNLGAFYKLGDQQITNCFYVGQGLTLYPGYKLPVAGSYIADLSGAGTPPTVAFTYRTNLTALAGNVTSLSLTNTLNIKTATLNTTGNAVIGGTLSGDGSGLTALAAGQLTGTIAAGRLPALTGDVTSSAGSAATTLANIPPATPVAGSLLATAIAAPATPAAGKGSVYVDSTSKNLAVKNDAGTVNHGVQSASAVSHQWVTAISDAGAVSQSQPAISDITAFSSASLATQVTDETGTGALVFANTPTLVTPVLGVATATSVNKWTFTAPTTAATLTAGADNLTYTGPSSSQTLVGTSSTDTLSNKRITARVTTITSSATPAVNSDNCDCVTITALAAAITSMTSSLTGTPNNFDQLEYRIKDDGTARAITWGASFVAGPTALPTTTTVSKCLHVYFEYDTVQAKWVCISSGSDA